MNQLYLKPQKSRLREVWIFVVKYRYINKRAFEDLSITRLIQMGLNALVEDLRYVKNHLYVLKPCKKNSNQEVVDMGYHTGRLICDVVTAIQAGKAIATKFKDSKLGGKLIEKFKGSGNKGKPPLKMNLQYFADKGGNVSKYLKQLDNFSESKINHMINGSKNSNHGWEKLVPDKNWNAIKNIVNYVMENGTEGPYKSVFSKKLRFKGYEVEVTYNKLLDGTIKISDAWINQ